MKRLEGKRKSEMLKIDLLKTLPQGDTIAGHVEERMPPNSQVSNSKRSLTDS